MSWPRILCATCVMVTAVPVGAQTTIPASSADWILDGGSANAILGSESAPAGDVNGDGFDDVLITASGSIHLYEGSAQGLAKVPSWSFGPAVQGSFYLGFRAGDVNGDGFDDVLIGDPGNDDPVHDEGRALLFMGSAAGLPGGPSWVFLGDRPGLTLGWSLGGGDVNGDGLSDVIVVAADRVVVFNGTSAGLATTPSWMILSSDTSVFFLGNNASDLAIGDMNGDGYVDLAFTTLETRKNSYAARLFVYKGSKQGLGEPRVIDLDLQKGSLLAVVAPAGDTDGDGLNDVAVIYYSLLSPSEPGLGKPESVVIYNGSNSILRPRPRALLEGVPSRSLVQAGTAGDLNGDGYADVFVAESFEPLIGPSFRAVLIYTGGPRGASDAPRVIIGPEQAGDQFPFWFGGGARRRRQRRRLRRFHRGCSPFRRRAER